MFLVFYKKNQTSEAMHYSDSIMVKALCFKLNMTTPLHCGKIPVTPGLTYHQHQK